MVTGLLLGVAAVVLDGVGVGRVVVWPIQLPARAVAREAIAIDVAQVVFGRSRAGPLQVYQPGLDDHATGPMVQVAAGKPCCRGATSRGRPALHTTSCRVPSERTADPRAGLEHEIGREHD